MTDRLTQSQFAAAYPNLHDWRVLRHDIVALFVLPTFSDAVAMIGDIAVAADSAGHHPDIELRFRRVRVSLTTHDVNGLSDIDGDLATTISGIASDAGAIAEPHRISRLETAIDVMDIGLVMPFWKAVLAYVEEPPDKPEWPVDSLVDPLRINHPIWFQQMDEPRLQRNRVHYDIRLPADIAEERIATAVAAGGRLVTDAYARAFWVLADPEGNEICICSYEDRD